MDLAPAEVYATLLDAGQYLCSERTMYRVLGAHQEVRERRQQLRHPRYAAPELLARRPNELWSWDITKLLGPAKWTYFYLYVMLDVFSRYVVGWMVSHGENAALAEQFIRATCDRQGIGRDQLTIHADRGQAMVSKSVAFLLADLGVTKTHSRPHVSNDNPFSEAQFKTLKYRPENGLSLDTCGRPCVLVTPRSASKRATGLEVMAGPRSAWTVSCSRAMAWRAQVSRMNWVASVALSRWATIQPTTYRLKTSSMTYR